MQFAVHFRDGFAGRFAGIEDPESVEPDGQILQCREGSGTVMLANAAVVFAVGGVSRKVQFVFDAPMSTIECKQPMCVGFFLQKAGDAADGFYRGARPFGTSAAYHEDLRGEGEVDPTSCDGRGDDAPGVESSAGLVSGAMGRGKKRAPRGALRSVCAGRVDCL